jgi:phosphoglycerate dehydrogenase-like enzyme
MAATVLMYVKGHEHIRAPLDALGRAIKVATFDRACRLTVDSRPASPGETAFDYVWLSTPITGDGIQEEAFALVESLKSVRVLQTCNAGLDHPFYRRMATKGTTLCNSSAQGVAIAEYVMGQVLAVMQPIALQRELQARREWRITPFRELSETRWLIYGFGPIGREITRRAQAFGARVTVVRRTADTAGLADAAATFASAGRHLAEAEFREEDFPELR